MIEMIHSLTLGKKGIEDFIFLKKIEKLNAKMQFGNLMFVRLYKYHLWLTVTLNKSYLSFKALVLCPVI